MVVYKAGKLPWLLLRSSQHQSRHLLVTRRKTKTMWNPSRNVRWRRDSRGIMRRIDVRRDIDGNVDHDFYTAWDTAVYERSAEANINNDLLSACTEADIW